MRHRLVVIMALGVAVWYVAAKITPRMNAQQMNTQQTTTRYRPGRSIEAKALGLDPENEASVRAVADEIFNYPNVLGRFPSAIEGDLKDRLVRSESNLLHHNRQGVREEDIVALFNCMADRLKLPDFSRTSVKQVRAMRMMLAVDTPIFMGRGMADSEIKVGESVNPEMSVLQAVYLSSVLINQKSLDPSFQTLPDQWDREFHGKEIQRIKERQALRDSGVATQHIIGSRANSRKQELHQAVDTGAKALSTSEAADFLEDALKILKVDR